MAAVTVAFDGIRVHNCESATLWTNEGTFGEGVETDYYYQGGGCIAGLVKTGEVGAYYTHGTTYNMSTTDYVWIAKVIQTNKDAIDGLGLQLKIGSANSAAYLYYIYSATTYPAVGGWQTLCIQPNISQWYGNTLGTPDLTVVDVYGIRSDASAQAKAPNLGMDSIDIMVKGEGLTLTRGDSTDANGDFDDFVSHDEGTQDNRYAVVQTRDGVIYVNGTLNIGNSTVNTEFTDENKVVVFPDHLVSNGFCGIAINAANSGSNTQISSSIFNGRGALYTSDDTRPDYTVTSNVAQVAFDTCTFNVFKYMNLTFSCVLTSCGLLSGQTVNQSSANLYQCDITEPAVAPNEAFIITDNVTRIVECNFAAGSNGGHAVQCDTIGTYTWSSTHSGYSTSNGQSNSVFFNDSGGLITLNLATGADAPTVRNGTSATTDIVSSGTISITNMYTESEVRIIDVANNLIVDGAESVNGAVVSVKIASEGTGYDNADILTVSGGTGSSATLNVTTDASGNIVSAGIETAGNYTVDPTNPVSHTGGTGSGATFNLDIRGSFDYTYGGTPTYDIVVFHINYKDIRFVDFAFPADDSSLLISQITDRVYYNP